MPQFTGLMLVRSCLTCCAALVLYLSPRLDCMTVSPITYFTTESPSQYNRYVESGDRAKSHYGSNGSPSYSAYGYGHRSMPESSAYGAAKARRSHEEQRQGYAQPYETPHTYEYMSNPSRKTSEASRVPGTERRPPAGDVELIGDGPRKEQHHRRVKKKRKKIRKQASPDGDDYRDGDGRAAEPDVGSSSKRNVQRNGGAVSAVHKNERWGAASEGEKRTPLQQQQQRAKKNGGDGPHRDKEEIDEEYAALDARTKHKIHKKNEYSKRQQFFDEEHVDDGKKRPAGSTVQGGRGKKVHVKRGDVQRAGSKRKWRAKKDHDVKKRVQQNHGHGGTRPLLQQGSSQGYGQVLAVR